VKIQKTLPPATAVYKVVRFAVLALVILTQESLVGEIALRGAILSLSAGSLIIAVLFLQYALTGAALLLTPLRIGSFLEAVAAAILVALQIIGLRLGSPVYVLRGVAPIFFFVDTMVFLFLLLLSGKEH
jgi:hypothetical protein